MVEEDLTVEQMMSRMLRPKMFAVHSRLVGTRDQMGEFLRAHLVYMIELEKAGVLFASGPYAGEDGKPDGSGLTVLRARDFKHATEIARADPMVAAGVRECEVRQWTLNEGSIQVRIDLSDGVATIDR